MAADARVVPDLDQIINFGALAHDRIAESAAIDRRIRADFDIVLDDDAAELRNFEVARRAARCSRNRPGRCGVPP